MSTKLILFGFGRDETWYLLRVLSVSAWVLSGFTVQNMHVTWIGNSVVCRCERECERLFVSTWFCEKLATCPGCDPMTTGRGSGWPPRPYTFRKSRRYWKWKDGLLSIRMTVQREAVIVGSFAFVQPLMVICFPLETVSRAEPLRTSLDGWAKKGRYIPLLVYGVYSEQTRIYFCDGLTSFFWKTPKRILSRGSSTAKHHRADGEHGKRWVTLLPRPSFSSSPSRSFQTLTLCRKMHDNCPSCASLNLAATVWLFTVVWHWTLCLGNMCVWKQERGGRDSDLFPLSKTLVAFISSLWRNVTSVWWDGFSESQKWLLHRRRIFISITA